MRACRRGQSEALGVELAGVVVVDDDDVDDDDGVDSDLAPSDDGDDVDAASVLLPDELEPRLSVL
jgi:hypothetical protein